MEYSVLVFTRNEALDIGGCLRSVRCSSDIHVCDSGSTDRTVELCRSLGAKVTSRNYDDPRAFGGDEAKHKNWALRSIDFKHEWILMLDADERLTPRLEEALMALEVSELDAAFRLKRLDHIEGKPLRWVVPTPFNVRLVRRHSVRFERAINPVLVVDGSVRNVEEHFLHYPFSKGYAHWFSKHNDYSSAEAEQLSSERVDREVLVNLFARDKNVRRRAQKRIFYKLPGRPVLIFAILFIFRLGFLDGRAGLRFVLLRAIYEWMVVLKIGERERAAREP